MDEPKEVEFKASSNTLQTLFKNNSENNPQDEWIAEFKHTKEYILSYE